MIKQESVYVDLHVPAFPICKGPAQQLVNHCYQQKLNRVPKEMLQEQQTCIQNRLWMVHTHWQRIAQKGTQKYLPTILLEEQPGFCYLHLFRREICDLIDWP